MAKIYTRLGDEGDTLLLDGQRVRKDDVRMEVIGTVDELSAVLGIVRAELTRAGEPPAATIALVERIQHLLLDLGAELAAAATGTAGGRIDDRHVAEIEAAIDEHEAQLEPLREFILAGGSPAAAELHLARSVCRRAERRLVALTFGQPVRPPLLRFVNRLSDLLFVLARAANRAAGVADVRWRPDT